MPSGIELATAYVSLTASTAQLSKDINRAFADAEKASGRSSKKISANLSSGLSSTKNTAGRAGAEAAAEYERALKSSIRGERIGEAIGRPIGKGIGIGIKAGIGVAAAGATAAVGALTYALTSGFERLKNIDNARFKLKALGNSAEDVNTIMQSATDSVKGTAFSLDKAANTAASAVAAGVKPGKELTKYLSTTADAAAVAGTSLDDMGSIFNKVQTNGKAYTDDLQQLADRGLPIFTWLQEQYGVTGEALRKMVEDGKVSAADFQTAVETHIGGAATTMGESLEGSIENMKASIARLGANFLAPILGMDPAKEGSDAAAAVQRITDKLNEMGAWVLAHQDDIKQYFDTGVDVARDLAGALGNVAGFLKQHPGLIEGVAVAFVAWKTITGVSSLITSLNTITSLLKVSLPAAAGTGAAGISAALARVAVPAWLAYLVGKENPLDPNNGIPLPNGQMPVDIRDPKWGGKIPALDDNGNPVEPVGTADQWQSRVPGGGNGPHGRAPAVDPTGGLLSPPGYIPYDPRKTPHHNAGGPITGTGPKGKDSVLMFGAPGEHVWTDKEVDAVGGQAAMYALRADALAGRIPGYENGGAVGAIDYAYNQAGKPYQYGAFDCSMLASQVYARMAGLPPGRYFTTDSDFEKLGFKKGYKPGALNIGTNGGSGTNGHMAVTLPNGVNAENAGGAGSMYGGDAKGANDFSQQWYYEPPNSGDMGALQANGMQAHGLTAGAAPGPLGPDGQPVTPGSGATATDSGRTEGYIPAGGGNASVAGTSFASGLLNMGAEAINGLIDQAASAAATAASAAATAGSFGAGGQAAGPAAAFAIGMGANAAKRGVSYGFQLAGIGTDALIEQLTPFGAPRWLSTDPTAFMPQMGVAPAATTTAEQAHQPGDQPVGPTAPEPARANLPAPNPDDLHPAANNNITINGGINGINPDEVGDQLLKVQRRNALQYQGRP
ncbi:tape measure protein [[Mycobacterium] fortunisiensis]|uniref:tape measure protein n=1 Tax=[Mycobacterium] fortunisiensis TaxID=2600579 RepID=UPI001C267357|nr:tape measure protein [[Mycobacterium] fortunisiensis]